jgi:hypothetical protein
LDKFQYIENLFLYILKASFLIPIFIILVFLKKTKKETVILGLLIYSICFFILIPLWDYIPTSSRKIYATCYTFLEYSFFSFLLFHSLKQRTSKVFLVIASICFLLFLIFYFILGPFKRVDSVPIAIETILILSYIVFYFYEQLTIPKNQYLFHNYFFWIILGVILYLSGSLFIYMLANSFPYEELMKYWVFTYIVEILKNILFGISVIIYLQQTKNVRTIEKNIPNLDMI